MPLKGLGAPVGSVLVGSEAFIKRAHRFRKMLGGGMRQAGTIAAAGAYALEHNVARLADDHARARRIAEAVDALPGFSVDLATVETNMAYIELTDGQDPAEVVAALAEHGVDLLSVGPTTLRAVTHLHVTDAGVDAAIAAFQSVAAAHAAC